ncbi:nucleotide disphospho-sugar-binding domain-containing protein [Gordonia sp. LSe1-13]|uniref:Nucleotide disphospho-sugar-binding domain-containing protein n=1 Tax=Gordonia sesuvii TaxID=3116777 RepID=A0ABU7M7R4_9ACTN|nr:nucleotide disphospho-sugar-binding domain-containing protein [Gordonia sp. LSe1-13]
MSFSMSAFRDSSSLRIAMILYGSRGDIQPGICLALELQRRGHHVTLLAPPNFVELANKAGVVTVRPVGLDAHTAWTSDAATAAQQSRNPLSRWRFALDTVRGGFAAFDDDLVGAFLGSAASVGDVDTIVVAPLCQDRGLALAERLGAGLVVLRYGPMSENGMMGAIPGLTDSLSPQWKRRSWRMADRITWTATGWNENRFRRRLGLPRARAPLPRRLSSAGVPQIQAYDDALIPGLAEEWGDAKPVVGFFDLPTSRRRSIGEIDSHETELGRWLATGTPPLFITFGSMPLPDHDKVVATVRAAARTAGLRCLVAGREHRGVDPDDDTVFVSGPLDHASVLPKCAAALHHGGAGTTAATLRAGLPTFVCPITADQPFWGHRVQTLGLGCSVRLSALTRDALTAGLRTLMSAPVRAAARTVAERMVESDKAVAVAADIIETSGRPA